jgi:hypothetical protein
MGAFMNAFAHNVLPPKRRPTENALRDALAEGLARVQGSHTDQDTADLLGWSIGTVRNVRNRKNTACVKIVSDALHGAGPAFLAPLLALHGLRAVPVGAGKVEALPVSGLLHKLLVALQDGDVSAAELADMRALIEDVQAVLDGLRQRDAAGVR